MLKSTVALLAAALLIGAAAVYAADGDDAREPAHRERHPEMRHALQALQRAKGDLEKADHDFGGHRAKALEDTDQAIREIKEGLAFDKK